MATENGAATPIDPGLARRAFRDGDVAAYRDLVRQLEPLLRRHAVRLLGPDKRSDVDDLLQETLEHLHRAAAVVDNDRPIEAWAFVIMRNLCVDWHRTASRRPRTVPELPQDLDVGKPGQVDSEPADAVEQRALLLDLRNALMQLPLNRHRLIQLVYFKGIPLTEAASKLRMSYGTARYQLTAALGQLRTALGKTPTGKQEEDRDAQ